MNASMNLFLGFTVSSAEDESSCGSSAHRTFIHIETENSSQWNYYSQRKLNSMRERREERWKLPLPKSHSWASIHHSPLEMPLRWARKKSMREKKKFIIKSCSSRRLEHSGYHPAVYANTRVGGYCSLLSMRSKDKSNSLTASAGYFLGTFWRWQRIVVVVSLGLERESVPKKVSRASKN